MNDLYKENYTLLKKEIEEDYRKWKDLPCSKAIYMFNAIPIKILMIFIRD
jgi:hypothetical protein